MKKIAISFCTAMLVFSLISCGSKPAPEAEPEPQAPVIEKEEPEPEPIVQEEIKEEEPAPEPEPEPEPEPVVIDNTETFAAVDNLRGDALNSGAEEFAKEELDAFDELYKEIKFKGDNGEDIKTSADELKKLYEALSNYAKAKTLQAELEEFGINEYALREYNIAVAVIDEIDESELDADEFLEKSKDAYSKMNTAYIQGYKALARESREDALKAKKDADGVKAGVAKKKEYNGAVDLFKKADALYAMQAPEKACDYYWDSEDIFIELYETLFEQRAKVQAAIDAAKKKVAESARIAEQADMDAPISSSDADLVEEEDTVLLEDDVYEDPSDFEADIPEDISAVEDGSFETDYSYAIDADESEEEKVEQESAEESEEITEDRTEESTEEVVEEEPVEAAEIVEESEEITDGEKEEELAEETTDEENQEVEEETAEELDEEIEEDEYSDSEDFDDDEDADEDYDDEIEENVDDEEVEEDL